MKKSSNTPWKFLSCVVFAVLPCLGFSHQYSALIAERRYAEVEAEITKKLKEDPKNADSLMARSELILALGQVEHLDESLDFAEKCVEWHSNNSGCHEALGNAAAAKLAIGGLTGAFVYAKKTRESYLKALEKDPSNFRARISLIKFYLQAPGIIGGSNDKARLMAIETVAINKDVGNLAVALCDIGDGNDVRAEAAVLGVNLANVESIQASQRDLLFTLGQKYLGRKQFSDARRLFSEIHRKFPRSELGSYGLGLVAQNQGQHEEALRYFEDALMVLPKPYIYYSIGNSAVAQKDKVSAIKAFQAVVDFKPVPNKKMRADALAKLDELKG